MMERWKLGMVSLSVWVYLVVLRLDICVSANEEAKTLLSFKEEQSPSSLSNLNENYPEGHFQSLNARKATHRRLLLSSSSLTFKDSEHTSMQPAVTPNHHSSKTTANAAPSNGSRKLPSPLIASISVVAAIVVLALTYFIYMRWRRTKRDVTVIPLETGISGKLQKAFVTGTLLRRSELEVACEDFSNIVCYLSNGTLYKGTLPTKVEIAVTSTDVALAKNWSDQRQIVYRNKISVLSQINHKNFMNLIGYCEEEEPFTRMMVFEYAPNGTLFEHLHIKESEQLEWGARLRVAMGILYCLEYIETLGPSVTLRNLNSSCIYLTEDYAAKISDLEFWFEEHKDQSESSDQDSTVYRFGIILLEIISGRRQFSEDNGLLVLWASSYLNGKRPLMDMVDQTLANVEEETVLALADVIRSCINKDSNKAPTIEDVAARMRHITSITPEQAHPRLTPMRWSVIE